MNRLAAKPALMVLALLVGSCASGVSDQTAESPVFTESGTDPVTTSDSSASGGANEEYLAELDRIDETAFQQIDEFAQGYFEENPERDTVEAVQGFYLGILDGLLAHSERLESVEPPPDLASDHEAYVSAYRNAVTVNRETIAGFTALEEFQDIHFESFFDSPGLRRTPDQQASVSAWSDACHNLFQSLTESAAHRCPASLLVNLEAGDVWRAEPNPIPGTGIIEFTIRNTGDKPIRPVILEILEGDPLDLPIVDGLVDISRCGHSDPASGYAAFRLIGYDCPPSLDSQQLGLLEMLPGEGSASRITSDLTLVVFDYQQGEFEAGAYVVIERSRGP